MSSRTSLAGSAAKGMAWLFGQTVLSRGVQILSQVALAWFLVPDDFGKVGLAYTVTAFFGALFGFNFEEVSLQRGHGMRLWLPTAFWLSLVTGLVGTAATMATAPASAGLYGHPEIAVLIILIAGATPSYALATVPNALLRSRMDFRPISVANAVESVGVSVSSVLLALAGFGVLSFAIPVPVFAAVRTLVLWGAAGPRGCLARPNRNWRRLIPPATATMGTRILGTIVTQVDYVVLGLLVSSAQVGLYYFAYRLAIQPLRLILVSYQTVLFPTLTKYSDRARQTEAALQVARLLTFVVTGVSFLQALLAEPLLALLFSPNWAPASSLIQALSIGIAFDTSAHVAGLLMNARGRFQQLFRLSALALGPFLVAITVGALVAGALGTAIGVAIYHFCWSATLLWLSFGREGGISARRLAGVLLLPTAAAALAAGAAVLAGRAVAGAPLLVDMVVEATTFVVVYASATWFVARDLWIRLIGLTRDLIRRRRPQ